MFKIFPRYLFRNLKFLKIKTNREKTNKILNAVFGIIVGIVFSIVILLLLMSADDYFNKFVSKAFISINFDFSKLMQFVIFFIIIFSIGVNLIRNRYIVMKENEKEIFIDEMADLGDEWTIEELKGTSYEKMSLERAIRERKSALGKMDGIIGTITF